MKRSRAENHGRTWHGVPHQRYLPEVKFLAGVSAQDESDVVYHNIHQDLVDRGIIFADTDSTLRDYPEFFREYFGTVIPAEDDKFAALIRRCGLGRSFVYISKEVRSPMPLSSYCRIDSENMEQFERTIIIADEGSFGHYSAAFTTPIYAGKSRHSAVVELIVKAQMRYTTLWNWA